VHPAETTLSTRRIAGKDASRNKVDLESFDVIAQPS
jgi:hypothetical protein